jgi:hypothetical protein
MKMVAGGAVHTTKTLHSGSDFAIAQPGSPQPKIYCAGHCDYKYLHPLDASFLLPLTSLSPELPSTASPAPSASTLRYIKRGISSFSSRLPSSPSTQPQHQYHHFHNVRPLQPVPPPVRRLSSAIGLRPAASIRSELPAGPASAPARLPTSAPARLRRRSSSTSVRRATAISSPARLRSRATIRPAAARRVWSASYWRLPARSIVSIPGPEPAAIRRLSATARRPRRQLRIITACQPVPSERSI